MFSRWQRRIQGDERQPTNHANLLLVTPPIREPVTLDEAKTHLNVDFDSQDDLIETYIGAARESVEKWLRRALITQTRDLIFDWGPAWYELPYPPIQAVTTVYFTDLGNNERIVPATTYYYNTGSNEISLMLSQVWPLGRGRAAHRTRYTCGYGDDADDVPASIRLAILNLTSYMFDNRGAPAALTEADKQSLMSYRIAGPPFRYSREVSPTDILA